MLFKNVKKKLLNSTNADYYYTAKEMCKDSKKKYLQQVYDVYTQNGENYAVVDAVKGERLGDYVRKHGTLTENEVITILKCLSKALRILEKHNAVHMWLDIEHVCFDGKTAVLLEPWETVKIEKINDRMIFPIVGCYTALECYSTKFKLTPSANIYSLGAIAYFMLSAKLPTSVLERIEENVCDMFEDLRISAELKYVLNKCYEIKPENRYRNVDELLGDLKKIRKR